MGTSDTLRSVIDAGRSSKRLDELSSARVIGKIALQVHSAQQKAGAGKAVGPITPSHVKLAPSGEAKLDLGEGSSLGYSSPEQINGSAGDRRSDVFSLGTVLWEALTYARLFDAMNDAAVKVAVQEREIMAPSELNANVPAELSAICMRALARNPSDRYQSLKAMAVEIEEFLEEAGYADDDTKIASYLGSLHTPPEQVKITMPPLTRPASSTQPPPTAPEKQASGTQPPPNVMKQPAAPSMLGEPPKQTERAKNASGAALAAALANAGAQPATSNGATTASAASPASTSIGLPPAKSAATIVGVPKADEWQDSKSTTHPPQNVAAPAVPPADASASAAVPGAPLTPMPPVLPQGSAPTLRSDKSTIAATVPPMVNATVDAKHVEAKAPALIVDEPKQPAMIVDDGKTTLVDDKPPAIEVPKLVNGRLPEPESRKPSQIETLPVTAFAGTPGIATKPAAQTKPAETKPAEPKRAESKPSRAKSQSEAKRRAPSSADKSAPHPVGAVSLGPGPGRESKDVLAGWGWGTDKHDVLPPEGYSDDLDYEPAPEHNARKTLLYVIGGGFALVALITIIALASGGSKNKKKPEAAAKVDTSRPAIDQPPTPTPPPPAPAPAPDQGSAAAAVATGSAQPAPAPDETAKAAEAAKAEADRVAAEQETARQAEVAKQEAAKAEAEAKQAEAARLAQEKADAKKAADDAKKAEAARVAEEKNAKKAEATRLAAERAEAKKAEAAKRAEAAKEAQAKRAEAAKAEAAKRTENAKRAPTRTEPKTNVAKAEPKADVEQLYRTGLQQYARGDTQAALASLRTALAANPSYAPTWRGLGLVFEKLGEKDQARAAFKRYLQLSPGAGDAEQIKSRLERLGS